MLPDSLPDHLLPEPEHAAALFMAFRLSPASGTWGIRVMAAEKPDDMETAFVDIEMETAGLPGRIAE